MQYLPVYHLSGLSEIKNRDLEIAQLAPYISKYQKLLQIPHGHSFYHAVLFTEGRGKFTIDFDWFEVKSFRVYFMIPGQVHNWQFEGMTGGYVLNFSDSFFQSFLLRPDYLEHFPFFLGSIPSSVIDIPESMQAKILSIFDEMLKLRYNTLNPNVEWLKVLMLQLFFNVAEISSEKSEKSSSNVHLTLLRNFQKLIDKNYKEFKHPKEYARLLFVTPNHLNSLTRKMLGMSAGDLIRKRVVLEAKRLLVNLEIPISRIAYELNFNDNSYFTKFFKKYVGCTPEEFRNEIEVCIHEVLDKP